MMTFLRQLFADLRALPPALWVLTGGQFINRFGSFVYPFFALYLTRAGFSLGQVSVVLAAIAAGQMGAPLASGYLADAIGRRNTIVASLVGGAVTILALYWAHTLPALMVAGWLHGFTANMFGPASHALLSDVVPEDKRVTAHAMFRLALNAGYAAGPAVAGFLFTHSPVLIFVGDAATTLIFAGLALAFLPHGLRTITGRVTSPTVTWRSWCEAAVDAWRNRPFAQLVFGKMLMSIAFVQVFNVLALHATAQGLSPVVYGVVMGFNGVLIMLVELPLAQWIKRFEPRRVLVVGFLLVGAGCASFGWAETTAGFLFGMGFFTVGEMISLPIAAGYGAQLAPPAYRGRYFGLLGLIWGVSALTGSTGVWAFGQVGAAWWWWSGGFGLLAGVVMMLRLRDMRPAPVVVPAVG